jgi:hypothetical protein
MKQKKNKIKMVKRKDKVNFLQQDSEIQAFLLSKEKKKQTVQSTVLERPHHYSLKKVSHYSLPSCQHFHHEMGFVRLQVSKGVS